MTPEKVLEVIGLYRKLFESQKISKIKLSPKELMFTELDSNFALAHCHAMLDEMELFVREGRMEKVFRWLGFLQGVLWLSGRFTLNELKNHNRPNDENIPT